MPTYYARGLSATLSVMNLGPSLGEVFDLKHGQHQKQDALRTQGVGTTGVDLPECPIGADGTEKGVQQFIGVNEDMPFYMVEAGERLHQNRSHLSTISKPVPNHSRSSFDYADSSLSTDNAFQTMVTRSQKMSSAALREDSVLEGEAQSPDLSKDQTTREVLDDSARHHALCLAVEVPAYFFMPPKGRAKSAVQELLIEVWLNGELVNVTFVNKRSIGLDPKENIKVLFGGTRIHRQSEKPWIYARDRACDKNDDKSAEKRWMAVGRLLKQESENSGRNEFGDRSPASEFLAALAKLQIPVRLKNKGNLGIIDVVITAGKGGKYASNTIYLTKPTPMDSSEFCRIPERVEIEDDSSSDELSDDLEDMQDGFELSNLPSDGYRAPPSSPEVSLMQQRSTSLAFPDSPTPKSKTRPPFASDDGAEYKKLIVNVNGARGKNCRPLAKRLGDMRQMGEANRAVAFEDLSKELDEDAFRGAIAIYNSGGYRAGASTPKRVKLTSQAQGIPRLFGENDTLPQASNAFDTNTFMPAAMPLDTPYGADNEAVLTQRRIDMALDVGATSNGALLRRISGQAPQHTPKRATKASSLAHSPSSQAVKPQPHMIKRTPIANTMSSGNKSQGFTGAFATSTMTRNRHSGRYNKNEITPAEALDAFETPRLCKKSVVSYAGPGVQRHIGKARNGEFNGESLVVGMRFVVV